MNEQKKGAINRGVATASRQVQRSSAQDFVRGVIAEMRRVTWPTRDEWVSATVLTVVLVVTIGLFTFVADQVFGAVINAIHVSNIR